MNTQAHIMKGNRPYIDICCQHILQIFVYFIYFFKERLKQKQHFSQLVMFDKKNTKYIFQLFCLKQIATNALWYCKEAVESVERVSYCPRTKKEWDTAATRKDCSRLAGRQDCTDAKHFRYHCVINEYRNETLEVCAPRRIILGILIYYSENVKTYFT